MAKPKIGIVDTMFARVNMGEIALDELGKNYPNIEVVRATVPGIKDLPAECKRLLDEGCGACMALGMVGGAPIDTLCGHEASLGLMQIRASTGKHVIEVFVHENEAWDEKELFSIFDNRVRKHAHNAALLLTKPAELTKLAGQGVRQGRENEGIIDPAAKKPLRLAFVVAEFNRKFADEMLAFALEEAKKNGADAGQVLRVPGAFEIPLAAKKLLGDKKNDAVVALGYVKKGETMHDRIISKSVADAIMGLSLENRKPITLGIITVADAAQAEERKEGYARRAVQAAVKAANELRKQKETEDRIGKSTDFTRQSSPDNWKPKTIR